jgi:hypothetical protein
MKFKIGDKVVFIQQSYKEYAWKLNEHETYTVSNLAFSTYEVENYIAVKNYKGQEESTWYLEKDFMKIKELRKQKLTKIRKQYGN